MYIHDVAPVRHRYFRQVTISTISMVALCGMGVTAIFTVLMNSRCLSDFWYIPTAFLYLYNRYFRQVTISTISVVALCGMGVTVTAIFTVLMNSRCLWYPLHLSITY